MEDKNLRQYIGPITNAELIDSTGFDSLSPENVFIKRELTLILENGTRAALAGPEYLEFYNTPTGRENLIKSNISQHLIDTVLMIWGSSAVLKDRNVV